MLARVKSVATVGLETVEVVVEVDVANKGFPAFDMVGLPDKAVGESRARVRKAIENSGYTFPDKRITVNLAPADLHKEGSNYDLPIAVGILMASEVLPIQNDSASQPYFYGELGLDGSVKRVRGTLLVAMCAKENSVDEIFVPIECTAEGAVVNGVSVHPLRTLKELVNHISGTKKIEAVKNIEVNELLDDCLLYTSPSPRDRTRSRMPSSA